MNYLRKPAEDESGELNSSPQQFRLMLGKEAAGGPPELRPLLHRGERWPGLLVEKLRVERREQLQEPASADLPDKSF